jgi:hypothetical protein
MAQRLRAIARSTPGRLTAAMILLLVLGIADGVTAFTGAAAAGSHVTNVRQSSGPRTVDAQSLYRELSDADATAAAAFLAAGAEPAPVRSRYLNDIAAAGAYLSQVTAGVTRPSNALRTLATELPVYTGLVETARADNLLGYPVGAAYLREASGLMRDTLLPAANDVYVTETAQLGHDSEAAASYPYVAVALAVLMLAALVLVQRYLTVRTRRFVNLGLVVATVATLVAVLYQNIAWAGLHSHLDSARSAGSSQVELLAQARIAALQARADESLTLIARGSGQTFEDDFEKIMQRIVGNDGRSGLLAAAGDSAEDPSVRIAVERSVTAISIWQTVHKTVRQDDEGGRYQEAVTQTIGDGPTDAAKLFAQVDNQLNDGIVAADTRFNDEATAAANAIDAVGIVVIVLTLLTLAGVVVGVQRRIAEYR